MNRPARRADRLCPPTRHELGPRARDAPNARLFLEKLRTTKPPPVRNLRKATPWNLALLVERCGRQLGEMVWMHLFQAALHAHQQLAPTLLKAPGLRPMPRQAISSEAVCLKRGHEVQQAV